jgi:methylmalonyl-CoA decarboxylase
MTLVLSQLENSIGILTLNHNQKRNALSHALLGEMSVGLADFRQRQARVVILRASAGVGVWSAGHDVAELPQGHQDPLGWDNPLRRVIREIEECPAPVIAMVEGTVWGGACELVFACDLIVAVPNATFALTPAKLGVPYNLTGLLTFMSVTSLHIAKEMAFTGKPITAERAERLGIVNQVVPADQLQSATLDLAAQIVQNAPMSLAVMKEELNVLANAYDLSPLAFERIQARRRVVYNSKDYQEGIRAFLEKRKATFTGE